MATRNKTAVAGGGVQLSKLLTDKKKQEKGVWREFAPGLNFLIGSSDQAGFRNQLTQALANSRRVEMDGGLDAIAVKAMARWLLLGWEGLVDDEGAAIKYTVAKAEEILRSSTDVHRFVDTESAASQHFRIAAEEKDRKN